MANISFLSTMICLLWVFQSWVRAADQDVLIKKKLFVGQRVNLTCQFNSSDIIEWRYILGSVLDVKITNCTYNQDSQYGQCTEPPDFIPNYNDYNYQATLHNETSVLSLTAIQYEPNIQCRIGGVVQRNYKLISVDPSDILPMCTVELPSSDEDGVLSVALSCGVQSGLGITFTIEGIGLDIPDTPGSSQSLRTKTLHLEDFDSIHNAFCNAYVPGFNITRSCNYPNIVKAQHMTDRADIIVECDNELDVDWHLFDTDGREEDIKNRSWTREGGRSLLIRNVSEQDVGKVVVCHPRVDNFSNGNITFTVISEISRDTNEANSGDLKPGPDDSSPYFVPALLFLALWLITTAIFGVYSGCRPKRKKFVTSESGNASVPNARFNQSSNSDSNASGGAGDREIPLVNARTGSRGDPDTSNTNNSASNNAFELEGDGTHEHGLNRQSNNGSHLYFTLEKPSPSCPSTESFRRTSTSGIDRREDTNLASLNQPQSSHWQGYEAVGESDKGATCSYDLAEYAEVGDHLIGRSLPDRSVRPSIPKKPGKEEITENDISRLYSQVNK